MTDIHADRILILDFGSQYTQLIARRVRELGVYCEIHPWDAGDAAVREFDPKGIILSGGPESVTVAGAPAAPAAVFELGVPVLGICYGMQLLAQELGGRVERAGRAEYGKALLTRHEGPLFRGLEGEVQVWMSHQDAVTAPPPGWRGVAETEENPVAAIASPDGRAYGVQFHPEVAHTPKGMQILENFLELAGVKRDWTPEHVLEELLREVRERAGKDRVLLAVSGGVDSSVAALLLKEAGYEVVGAMMRFWPDLPPPSLEAGKPRAWESCCTPDAAYEARRVADRLGIPFYLLDYREVFEEEIISPFLQDYAQGRTPNPCARCNTFVKFGALLKQARRLGLDYVATGHYVRKEGLALLRGLDPHKDQTYFLWGTPKEALPHLLFPVGGLTKPEVRALAEKAGLPTARRPESQNLCFVAGDLKGFLKERLKPRPGPLVDALTGEVVGEHEGASLYTLGQRKGLGLYKTHLERYVVGVDPERNVVYVGPKEACYFEGLEGEGLNLLAELPEEVEVQVRYRTPPVRAKVESLSPLRLRFAHPVFAVTPGQSAVFYRGERLLGGAVIRRGLYNLAGLEDPRALTFS